MTLGRHYSVENPACSLIWWMPSFVRLMERKRSLLIRLDQCAPGAQLPTGEFYRKRTRILSDMVELVGLERMCCGEHKHAHLEGSIRLANDKSMRATKFASSYPAVLVSRWGAFARVGMEATPAFARRNKLFLLVRMDIHPHPGPRRKVGRGIKVSNDILDFLPLSGL